MNNVPIETMYNGILYRSKNEAKWAMFFELLNIAANYEQETVIGHGNVFYKPDFYFPKYGIYGEVKSSYAALHDPSMKEKIGAAIDYKSTKVANGLLLLGSFPFDVRIVRGLELRTNWLFYNKGVQAADAAITINEYGFGSIGLWELHSSGIVTQSIPEEASPDIRAIQNPVVTNQIMYNVVKAVNEYFYGGAAATAPF